MTALARFSNVVRLTAAFALVCAFVGVLPAAAGAAPVWRLDALSNTTAAPGESFDYYVQVTNRGDEPAEGTVGQEIVLSAQMPPGISATEVVWAGGQFDSPDCSATTFNVPAGTVTCVSSAVFGTATVGNQYIVYAVRAVVDPAASSGPRTAGFQVSGGGATNSPTTVKSIRVDPAPPSFGLEAFDNRVTDAAGATYTQAAGHPDRISTSIDYDTVHNPAPLIGDLWPVAATRDISVDLPPGFLGNPTGFAPCTGAKLAHTVAAAAQPLCAPASQVGTVDVRASGLPGTIGAIQFPIFNMVPPPGVPARFAFNFAGTIVSLDARLRSDGDYGLSVDARAISEGIPVDGSTVTFWGTPASHSHDAERACSDSLPPSSGGPTCLSGASEELAFLRNPTSCPASPDEGLLSAVHIDSWVDPGSFTPDGGPELSDPAWQSATSFSHEAPGYPFAPGAQIGTTGCDQVPFQPTITVQPTNPAADSPTGLDVDLTMPQAALENPAAIAQADVKDSVVTQPIGTRINPATADGLSGCSQAQIGYLGNEFAAPNPIHFSTADPACPDSSKIGTVEIVSPLQENPLKGFIYQAKQNENPFGSTLAFYAVAKGEGLILKLPAEVRTDPDTGQIKTIFKNNPQLPFEHYRLHFDSGSRAPLITPPTCGKFTTHSSFTGWANPGAAVQLEDSFDITSGPNGTPCPTSAAARPFNPSFSAGTANPLAGAFSPFVLEVGREDGMQELTGLDTTLPPGMIGKLAGIPYCSDAAIAAAAHTSGLIQRTAPSCPAAAAVGVTDAAAGAGALPFHNPGTAYLAGPYKGAPLSLAIVTPAVAGPLDLGTVVVRAALFVDPTTTQIHVVSDPLPTKIVVNNKGREDGFPLDLRAVSVQINRPDFTLNPTSCDPMAVTGTVAGTNNATAAVSQRFQVGNCAALGFKPRLALSLKGATKRTGNPKLRAVLTARPGDANIAHAAVTLPKSEFLDNAHIGTVCTRVQFAANACPAASIYGFARATTPLLDQPLQGPVYLRSSSHKLPDLVAALNGQITVDLAGRIDTGKGGGIRNTFEVVPDAPVTKFVLTMKGGKKGLLVNSTNFCKSTNRATVLLDAQNGKTADSNPVVKADCGGKAKKKHSGHKRSRH